MGWKPWELEQITHPREFRDAIAGYQWRLNWDLDCAAFVAFYVLIAFGGDKRSDGTTFTIDDMLGRELFSPLVPPTPLDEATLEERAMDDANRDAQAERSKMLIWAAMKAREAKDRGEDPSPWTGEESSGG